MLGINANKSSLKYSFWGKKLWCILKNNLTIYKVYNFHKKNYNFRKDKKFSKNKKKTDAHELKKLI